MGKFLKQKQGCVVLILQRKIIKSSKIQSQGGGGEFDLEEKELKSSNS